MKLYTKLVNVFKNEIRIKLGGMMNILVVLENKGSAIHRMSLEAIAGRSTNRK